LHLLRTVLQLAARMATLHNSFWKHGSCVGHSQRRLTLLLLLLLLHPPPSLQYPRPEFVAADLSKVKLADALAATSFDPIKTTLFTAGEGWQLPRN
jgi:hypothetical protein